MYLLIIELFHIEYKEDILLALSSCGITKGSVIEGQNIDKLLEADIPLFSGLIKSAFQKEQYGLMIYAAVESRDKAAEIRDLLKEADIDITREHILRMLLVPVEMLIDDETTFGTDKE